MSYVIEGECRHCGTCCLSMRLGGLMLRNPCISLGEDRCKFYSSRTIGDNGGHCLIMGRDPGTSISEVKDRRGNIITLSQIKWFEENCPTYPREGDTILPSCGFRRGNE